MKLRGKNILLILISLSAAVLALEGGLRAAGWVVLRLQARHSTRAEHTADFVAVAIGESTTQGVGGLDPDRNYPNILEKLLQEKCPGRTIRVENLGVAGTNSWHIANALPSYLERFRPDFVITMIGINDPYMSPQERSRSQTEGTITPPRVQEVIRPAPLRVVRLYRWLKESLASLFLGNMRVLTAGAEGTPEEILERIRKGEDIDEQKFAIHFSQPLQNISIKHSIEMHEKVLAVRPHHAWALLELGNLLRERDAQRSVQLHLLALDHLRHSYERTWFLCVLAMDYAALGDWDSFRRVEDQLMAQVNSRTVMFLADMYLRGGKADDATRLLETFLKNDPEDPVVLGTLRTLSGQHNTPMRAGALKPEELPIFEHLDFTRKNYIRILESARAAGAEVLVMQYPTRSASLLKRMLHGVSPKGWHLLSHEKNFETALRDHSYDGLFGDYLGGTFGHMTKLGHTVLASNAADFLLAHAEKLREICKK